MMKKSYLMSLVLLFLSGAVMAEPVVEGNTISWPDDGWYQVQDAITYVTLCDGTEQCTVPAGSYIVINHSTGERWENIAVEDATEDAQQDPTMDQESPGEEDSMDASGDQGVDLDGLIITGGNITWTEDGWYQVQSADDYVTVCEGGTSCDAQPGTYHIINHSTGQRWDDIVIAGIMQPDGENPGESQPEVPDEETTGDMSGSPAPQLAGDSLQWADDGWYQVQSAADFSTICEGGTSCVVESGTYIVINLSTGERWEDIAVEVASGNDTGTGDTASGDMESENPDDLSLIHI